MLSEVWSSSQACWDFSDSRSAWRRARSDSIAMMSPQVAWPGRAAPRSGGWLRSAARTRASLSMTWVVTSSDLRLWLLDLAEPGEGVHRRRRSARSAPAASASSRVIRPRVVAVVCSSATCRSHDGTSRITSARARRDLAGAHGDLTRSEMTARVSGSTADGLTCTHGAVPAGGAALGRRRPDVLGRRRRVELARPSGPARAARTPPSAGAAERRPRATRTARRSGQRGPRFRCHAAVTQRRRADRFPDCRRSAVTGCATLATCPRASRRPRRRGRRRRHRPGWPPRTGSAQERPGRRGRRARGARPRRRAACAPPRSAGSPSTSAPRRCSTGGPRRSTWPARSGSARTWSTPPPPRPTSGPAAAWSPMPRTLMGVPLDLRALDGSASRPRASPGPPWTRCCPPTQLGERRRQRRRPGRGAARQGGRRPAGGAAARRGVRRPRPRDLRPGRRAPGGGAARPATGP